MNLTRRHLLQAAATAAGACAVPAALASPAHGLSSGTVRGAAAQNPNTAWRMAGHGPARTNATAETVLSPTTVSGLRQTGSFL